MKSLSKLLPALNALVSVVAPFGIFVFFARWLEPEQLGVIAYSIAWIEVLKALTPLGLYEALLTAEDEDGARPAAGALALACAATLVAYIVICLISPAWMGETALGMLGASLALSAKLVFDVVATQPLAAVARRRDYTRMTLRGLIGGLGAVGLGIGVSIVVGPVVGIVTYYVSQSFLYWALLVLGGKASVRPSFALRALKPIWPNALLATQVRSIGAMNNFLDQIVVGLFAPAAVVAHYNLGRRVELSVVTAASTFIANIYQPMFARQTGDTVGEKYRRALFVMTWMFGVPAVVLALNSPTVVPLVFGAEWEVAIPIVQALALSGFARVIQNVQGAYFSVTKRNTMLRNRSLASTLLGLAAVATIPLFGVYAACWMIFVKNFGVAVWTIWPSRELASPKFMLLSVGAASLGAAGGAYGGLELGQHTLGGDGLMQQAAIWVLSGIGGYLGAALLSFPQVFSVFGRANAVPK